MRLRISAVGLAVLAIVVASPDRIFAATCFCKVSANGAEVAKPTKGGFVQGLQAEACRNYCRGVWDSKSNADLLAWAALTGQCGNIDLKMEAKIGTANYKEVRHTSVSIPCPPPPPPPPPPCNLLQNGDFATGLNVVGNGSMPASTVANWTSAFKSPQITALPGCGGNPGFVSMWGNLFTGEAIQQVLSTPLVATHAYKLSACVRWVSNNPSLPPFVKFRVRLSNGSLPLYTTPATVMGIIGDPTNIPPIAAPGITSQQWATVALADWYAPANTFNTITINPENTSAVNDGNAVSWGQIDNICLQDLSVPCPAPDPDFTLTAVIAAGNSSTYQLTATAPLPAGVSTWWQVEELDPLTGNVLPTATVTNPAAWWTNPTTNVFTDYNGTGTLGNTGTPGVFSQGHKYRITRGVWDSCHPWAQASHTVSMSTP